jgi:hypothetical protein
VVHKPGQVLGVDPSWADRDILEKDHWVNEYDAGPDNDDFTWFGGLGDPEGTFSGSTLEQGVQRSFLESKLAGWICA